MILEIFPQKYVLQQNPANYSFWGPTKIHKIAYYSKIFEKMEQNAHNSVKMASKPQKP